MSCVVVNVFVFVYLSLGIRRSQFYLSFNIQLVPELDETKIAMYKKRIKLTVITS